MPSNYSLQIQACLKKFKIEPGDKIIFSKPNGTSYQGVLMPRIDSGDKGSIILKLDSGYNIGLKFEAGVKIEKSKSIETRKNIEEEKIELGKPSSKYLNLKFNSENPPISLVSAGGTIAARVDYKTGGVCMLMKPEEFLHNVPEIADFTNLKKIVSPFTKASEDMDYKDWQKIAEVVEKELNSDSRGVLITLGTDVMHYISAALSFMLPNPPKPVVLVGSQRSPDRPSSDAGMNLICASRAALSDIAEVGICMHATTNDDYCNFTRGTRVRKIHTSSRQAFQPVGQGLLAKIWPHGKVFEIVEKNFHKRNVEKIVADMKFEPKVAFIKIHPNADPKILEFYWNAGYKGFVIEGTGFGHVPTMAVKSWIPTIKKIVKDGVPVAVASQTIFGRTNSNVYANLRILTQEAGAFHVEDMLPETAYVKLGWILGHTSEREKVRELMLKNFAGEINARSGING